MYINNDVYLGALFGGRVQAKLGPELCLIVQRNKYIKVSSPCRMVKVCPISLTAEFLLGPTQSEGCSGFVGVVVREKCLVPIRVPSHIGLSSAHAYWTMYIYTCTQIHPGGGLPKALG